MVASALQLTCLLAAQELSLAEGLHLEKRLFHASFATVCPALDMLETWLGSVGDLLRRVSSMLSRAACAQEDRREGMNAFAERREANFKDE